MGSEHNPADSPGAQRYNRIHRWLGFADAGLGFALLVALVATRGSAALRDIAYRAASQHYAVAVFFYVAMLLVIGRALGAGLDYYGFRLEHHYQLSNQKPGSWLWDQAKEFLLGLGIAGILVELVYFLIRQFPEHWWIAAWALFLGLFVLMAQVAPVLLLPIFYKF